MAFLRDLPKHKCNRCGKAAMVELLNQRNCTCGFYCRRCSTTAVAQMNAAEREQDKRDFDPKDGLCL